MKKTLSLLLAIVMMLSVLIIPATAAMPDEDVAEPCGAVAQCPECRYQTSVITESRYERVYRITSCTHHYGYHQHTMVYFNPEYRVCNNCGFKELLSNGDFQYTLCPYGPGGKL